MPELHITINGSPLCQHTATMAGIEQRRKVFSRLNVYPMCGHTRWPQAQANAEAWHVCFPEARVAVALGPCPADTL